MTQRSAQRYRKQLCDSVQVHKCEERAVDFFNVLTSETLLAVTEAHLPAHRERLYPPTVTLSMFIKQALEEDGSCQRAVNGWAVQRVAEGLSMRSVRTGGYCRARRRLPMELVSALTRQTGALLSARSTSSWRWHGRVVKLVDGTGISMPDTACNQAHFGQPSNQAEGVGFPQLRLVCVLCLSTGALIDAAHGPLQGKGNSENDLIRGLMGAFSPGEVMLADALYCSYWLIAQLQGAGVDGVFEQNGSRKTDFRRGRRLGPRDHIVTWRKPHHRPRWMSAQAYEACPQTLRVREVEVDARVLVTTMLNRRQAPKKALGKLYSQRWHVELDLRNIKTTLGMEVLRCKTPEMISKELWVNLLAYNLIRLLMAQAARAHGQLPRELSFKHALQLWLLWAPQRTYCPEALASLFTLMAQPCTGHRSGRVEPRARKRRPKPFPCLKVPRHRAQEHIRMFGYLPTA